MPYDNYTLTLIVSDTTVNAKNLTKYNIASVCGLNVITLILELNVTCIDAKTVSKDVFPG